MLPSPERKTMKHRIVHFLQKYLLNPPIKLLFAIGRCAAGICAAGNDWPQDRKAAPHARGQRTGGQAVLDRGGARPESRLRSQYCG